MKTIDLNDWILSGQGAQGKSYNHATDPGLMLKLYDENVEVESILREHRLACIAAELGVCTPDPGEAVTDGKRKGMIFKRIKNKRSICRVISEEPSRLEEMARLFAAECRTLHAIPFSNRADVPDARKQLLDTLDDPYFSPRKKAFLRSLLESMPEADCFIHGDLHFGNMITDGSRNYFIDMGSFAKGCVSYDLSMLRFVCLDTPSPMMKKEFHITRKQGRRFWKAFSRAYFGEDRAAEAEVKKWERLKIEFVGKFMHVHAFVVYILSGNMRLLFKPYRL